MSPTLKGVYDHGRLVLEGQAPSEHCTVLVTFLHEEPLPSLLPFRPEQFAFDSCRESLSHRGGGAHGV